MKKIFIITFVFFILSFSNLYSKNNSDLENKISKNLRCLICQGQSIYDSQSDFAISVKLLINQKINEGYTEEEIYNFFKDKYGEWVLYEPEFNKNTIFLWFIPIVVFILSGILIARKLILK